MPRAQGSPASRIIDYFYSAPVAEADLVFDIVRDAIRRRKAEQAERAALIKKGQAKAAGKTAAAAPAASPAPKGKSKGWPKGKPRGKKQTAPASANEVGTQPGEALPPQDVMLGVEEPVGVSSGWSGSPRI